MEMWLANFLGEGEIQSPKSSMTVNNENGSGMFPQNVGRLHV